MPLLGYFADANLLILLVAGSVDPRIIAKHRRLDAFTTADYDLLQVLLNEVAHVFVTPNTLTEASNLLRQHGEPERSLLMDRLAYLIEESDEVVVVSAQASANPLFTQLGLTNAVLLEAISPQTPLLTVDEDLYLAALVTGMDTAVSFREFMETGTNAPCGASCVPGFSSSVIASAAWQSRCGRRCHSGSGIATSLRSSQ